MTPSMCGRTGQLHSYGSRLCSCTITVRHTVLGCRMEDGAREGCDLACLFVRLSWAKRRQWVPVPAGPIRSAAQICLLQLL
jgi:hypothetical protein